MGTRLESLHLIETACWRELERAVQEREHAWHTLSLATVGPERAEARTVVVREVAHAARWLRFYTDGRSAKVAQMRAHPRGTLLGWLPRLGWQLRLAVRLEVEEDSELARARWSQVMRWPSAQDYLAERAPGTPLDGPKSASGDRHHFAVVTAHVESMDWLELHAEGARRALLAGGDSLWTVP